MTSPHYGKSLKTSTLRIGVSVVTLNGSVKELGIIFDKCFNKYDHLTLVCRAVYYHFTNIRSLKPFLTLDTFVTVVYAFVAFLNNCCNTPLYGMSDYNINSLQLFWLYVSQHSISRDFKISLTTYKSLSDIAPVYLCELHPERSDHPVTYHGSYLFNWYVRLVSQLLLCWIACRWILEISVKVLFCSRISPAFTDIIILLGFYASFMGYHYTAPLAGFC